MKEQKTDFPSMCDFAVTKPKKQGKSAASDFQSLQNKVLAETRPLLYIENTPRKQAL